MSIKIQISKKGYGKPYYIISMSNGFNGLLSVNLQTKDVLRTFQFRSEVLSTVLLIFSGTKYQPPVPSTL